MLNSLIRLIFKTNLCSKDTDIEGKCEDISNCEDLNQDIATILEEHQIINNSTQICSQAIFYTELGTGPGGSNPIILDLDSKGIDVDSGTKDQEFNCRANISQICTEFSANSNDIDDRISSKILNKINSKIDEHQEELGYSPNAVATSSRNTMKNDTELISHITTKTKSIIDQSQNASQKITYSDSYRKCGVNKKGEPVGSNISQKIDLKSVSKNIVKTTVQQLMKNDVDLRLSSNTKITKVTDRIMFFSLLTSVLFGFLTYKLFKMKRFKLSIKALIYTIFLVIGLGVLYAVKG
tara:strand:+ start:3022 stop:3906 length:885 start_codon:yes stop_codon:yes gene_type:complete